MNKVRFGIIGYGNMGSAHFATLLEGKIEDAVIAALCDINPEKLEAAKKVAAEKAPGLDIAYYEDYKDLLASGKIDAVLIATPHYFHPTMGIEAFEKGLHVLSEKPIGVYTKAVLEFYEAAEKSGKVFGIMYNQRTNPIYQKVRELIKSGELGTPKRCNWIITDWYRTQTYYNSGGWRATWKGEGGGVLTNQCPHQLDLWQWMFGMPKKVRGYCTVGKYHDIEVEDDVTIYAEYENGATAAFITTTGDFPGTNRLEITGDCGKIVVENDTIKYTKLKQPTSEHCATSEESFRGPDFEEIELDVSRDENKLYEHPGIMLNFTRAILYGEELLAPGYEGINGLQISNAAYLSSWLDKDIEIPVDPELYFAELSKKIATSKYEKKEVKETIADLSDSSKAFK